MATLRKELRLGTAPERVWDAVRDVGALHTRLVPGFVLDTRMDGETRVVTFANGQVVREPIVTGPVGAMQDQAISAMQRALERAV